MKRIVSLVLGALLLLALLGVATGCGGGGDTTTKVEAVDTTAVPGEGTETAVVPGGGADGAAVFASVCSGCHGGDGTGASAPDLTPRTSLTKERVVDQVTNGGTAMPAYGSQLSTDEISAVADYVLSDIVRK